jgi:hypothetical protein
VGEDDERSAPVDKNFGRALRWAERRGEERRSVEMICVTVEIREGALTRRVRITAPSIERALKIARDGKTSRRVRLVFPLDPDTFFIPEGSVQREAA